MYIYVQTFRWSHNQELCTGNAKNGKEQYHIKWCIRASESASPVVVKLLIIIPENVLYGKAFQEK